MGDNGSVIASRWLVVALALLIAATSGCLETSGKPPSVATLVVVLDTSGSTDLGNRCAETAARVRPLISDRQIDQLEILVLGTGDGDSLEPRTLVRWTTWTRRGRLMESPEGSAARREAFLRQVFETCAANIRATDASPVYESSDRAVRAINAHCDELERNRRVCTRRILAVHSDFRSMTGPFGFYLKSISTPKRKRRVAPPKALILDGIETTIFCGLSNTTGGDGISTDSVVEAWTTVLGRPFVADPTCAADFAFVPTVAL